VAVKFGFATVLSFARRVINGQNAADVKANPGGGANITGRHLGAPGDGSPPLPGDLAALLPLAAEGAQAIAGYIDPANAGAAAPGERRFYSRDASGAIVATIWLRNDGQISILNAVGLFVIDAAGSITLTNGAGTFTIDPAGNVTVNGTLVTINGATVPASGDVLTAAGYSVNDHEARITALEAAYNIHTHSGVVPGLLNSGPTNNPV